MSELNEEIKKGTKDTIESEFGDVLFSMINYARFINVNPENALEKTNKKFSKRFKEMEIKIKNENLELDDLSNSELLAFWNSLK